MFFVYVIRNSEERLYIGHTDDVDRRVSDHQQGRSRWTRGRGPWELVLREDYATRGEAVRRERALKSGRLNQELRARLQRQTSGEGHVAVRRPSPEG